MKIKKLMALAVAMLCTAGAWAQTDVTSTYLTNADFSSTDGWNAEVSSSYKDYGNGLIGTYGVRTAEGQGVSTVDATHLATEYCFGFEARWGSSYASYTQTTKELLIGVYTLTFDVENTNDNTQAATYENRFTVKVGEKTYTDNSTEWMNGKSSWTTHTISFTLEEAATATISLGYGTGSNNIGSKVTPTLHVSHLKLTYQSLLDGVKTLWEEAKSAAIDAKNNAANANVTGAELTALNAEIAKDEPTTKEGYEAATEALEAATAAFTAAKTNYDAFVAAKTAETPTLAHAATAKATALNEAKTATATSAEDAATKAAAIATALRAYYESHALAEGVAEAVNMTDRIKNNDASNGNNDWTWTGNKNAPKSNEPWTDASGNSTHTYFDGGNWNANSWTTTMKQSVSIPAGKYLLTAKGRAATNTTLTMAVGEKSVALPNIGSAVGTGVFDRGWGDASLEFDTDGSDIDILVTASSNTLHEWFSISNFRLVRLELYTEMAKAEDYAALNAAIEAAEAKTLGFDANEYAPYNNVEALNALATAKAVDQTAENGKDEITALTTALGKWTANATEVDAIYDGTLANAPIQATSENVVLPGWVTKSGNLRQTFKGTGEDGKACLADADAQVGIFVHPGTYNYGETAGYTMPLKAGQKYIAEAKYCAWANESNNNFTLTILKDGVSVATKSYGANGKACTEAGALKTVELYFDVVETDNYVLSVTAGGNTFMTDFYVKKAVAKEVELNETADYTPAETYANVTLKRNIKDGYNTVVLPFDLTAEQTADVFGTGAEVYTYSETAEGENSTITFAKKDEATIAANVPVLVKATAGATEKTINGVMTSAAGVQNVAGTNFDFVGSYSASTALVAGDYFFNNAKLYKSNGDNTMKGFRAYLKAKTTGSVKLIIEGLETGIEAINGQAEATDGAIYNVAGQRVQKAVKGLYIINGKKVMVK